MNTGNSLPPDRKEALTCNRSQRSARLWLAKMITEDGCTHDIRIKNLSASGAGAIVIDPSVELNSQQKVQLIIYDHPIISGRIEWINNRLFGVIFFKIINTSSFIIPRNNYLKNMGNNIQWPS